LTVGERAAWYIRYTQKNPRLTPLTLFGKNSPKNFPSLSHSIVAPNSV
jgi:hypothetical protein